MEYICQKIAKSTAPLLRRVKVTVCSFVAYVFVLSLCSTAKANDVVTTVLIPNESGKLWTGWNVSGDLQFKIRSEGENNCFEAWWNRNGFNSDRFTVCDGDRLSYNIPVFIVARLKGQAASKTAVAVSGSSPEVNSKIELCGKFVEC